MLYSGQSGVTLSGLIDIGNESVAGALSVTGASVLANESVNAIADNGRTLALFGMSVSGRINVQAYGASGAGIDVTTGTISASSTQLPVGSASGWSSGMGIIVPHAGTTVSLTTPGAPTVTPIGTTGRTTYTYKVVAVDAAHGYTAAGSGGSTASGNAALSGNNYNRISWTAVSGASLYAVYQTSPGTYRVGFTSGTHIVDIGYTDEAVPYATTLFWDIPTTAPFVAAADWLQTSINSISGTTFTLAARATTAASSVGITHDDTAAITNAYATGGPLYVPAGGNYFFCGAALNGSNIDIEFPKHDSSVIYMCPGQTLFGLSGTVNGVKIIDGTFVGGASVFHQAYTGVQTSLGTFESEVTGTNFYDYTGTEFGSDSVDWPYIKIDHDIFIGLDDNQTVGVLLPGSAGNQVLNSSFAQNRVSVKATSQGSGILFQGDTFIRSLPTANPQKPRIDAWLTGSGFTSAWFHTNKFGNELLADNDLHILFADDDTSTGTDEVTYMPKLKSADDVSIAATSATATSSECAWAAGDVGDPITVEGAGTGGYVLTTTIASYTNCNQVTLTATAARTVTGAVADWAPAYSNSLIGLSVSRNFFNGIGSAGQSPPILYSTSATIQESMIDHNDMVGGQMYKVGFVVVAPAISVPVLAGNIVGPNTKDYTGATPIPASNQAGFATLIQPDGGGANPSLSSCGTGTIASGSNNAQGQATATGATGCTVNFGVSNGGWANAPNCSVTDYSGHAGVYLTAAPTTGSFTVGGLTSRDTFGWVCIGH